MTGHPSAPRAFSGEHVRRLVSGLARGSGFASKPASCSGRRSLPLPDPDQEQLRHGLVKSGKCRKSFVGERRG